MPLASNPQCRKGGQGLPPAELLEGGGERWLLGNGTAESKALLAFLKQDPVPGRLGASTGTALLQSTKREAEMEPEGEGPVSSMCTTTNYRKCRERDENSCETRWFESSVEAKIADNRMEQR
jgi:hypothetical protein